MRRASTTRPTWSKSIRTAPLPRRPRCRRSPPPLISERRLLPAATIAAVLLLVAVSVQSVWWTPLNVDEELTLRLAQFSFRNVFHIVSTQRGGGPVHFWLEHFLQGWWPGLEALRPHTLLFAWLMWGTVLALRAAREGSRPLWILAGVVLGLTVFVHPTAPLYALTAFAAAAAFVPRSPRSVIRETWPGALA